MPLVQVAAAFSASPDRDPCHPDYSCAAQVSNITLLQNYYMQAYTTVRKYSSCFVALCPPESQPDGSAFQFFNPAPSYTKVIQDVHKCARKAVRQSSRHVQCAHVFRIAMAASVTVFSSKQSQAAMSLTSSLAGHVLWRLDCACDEPGAPPVFANVVALLLKRRGTVKRSDSCSPCSSDRLTPAPRRYYNIDPNANFSAWSQNAYVNQTAAIAAYVGAGGLPLVIGEWTLAGACRGHPDAGPRPLKPAPYTSC